MTRLRAAAEAASGSTPIQPLALMGAVASMLPKNAVVINETISSGAGLRCLLQSDDAQSLFGMCGGGIGWGLPAAIGAKPALPKRPVVAAIGDGSAMYTIQGLCTATHEKSSVVFVIINNSSYRILKQRTNAMKALAAQTDRYAGMELNSLRIDFVSVARGLRIAASRVGTIDEVKQAQTEALRTDKSTLIDVEADRSWEPV